MGEGSWGGLIELARLADSAEGISLAGLSGSLGSPIPLRGYLWRAYRARWLADSARGYQSWIPLLRSGPRFRFASSRSRAFALYEKAEGHLLTCRHDAYDLLPFHALLIAYMDIIPHSPIKIKIEIGKFYHGNCISTEPFQYNQLNTPNLPAICCIKNITYIKSSLEIPFYSPPVPPNS